MPPLTAIRQDTTATLPIMGLILVIGLTATIVTGLIAIIGAGMAIQAGEAIGAAVGVVAADIGVVVALGRAGKPLQMIE